MQRIWSISAAVCLIAAFIFFWFHNFDGVFVAAVLGSIAWLPNYRQTARERVLPVQNFDDEE